LSNLDIIAENRLLSPIKSETRSMLKNSYINIIKDEEIYKRHSSIFTWLREGD